MDRKRTAMWTFAFMVMTAPLLAQSAKSPKKTSTIDPVPASVRRAFDSFRASGIRAHTRYLSDDLLEGRGPGTRGDELTRKYIASQFEELGLEPIGDNGTYFQKVPLLGIKTNPEKTKISFLRDATEQSLRFLEDIVATNEAQRPAAALDSELVFVGHGVVAPEYNWNDYKGLDVKGKTVVMLVDDPPSSEAEPNLFGGKARTYYGRWTYKYEEALRQGASGAILVHTDDSAGYGRNVVKSSWGRQRPYVRLKPSEPGLEIAAWISTSAAEQLMKTAGLDLATVTRNAHARDFRAIPLNSKIQGLITSELAEINTANVVGRLRGSEPVLRDQAILYTAHHDHLGVGTAQSGDAIYNGAIDNATGVAVILEIARVWANTSPKPKRSMVFAAVAAEEGGLRGSEYYAGNPIVAAGKTVVNLNFDAIEQFGKVRNVTMLGIERSTFHPVALKVTKGMGIRIDPDEHPEQGSYYRSDHFSLAKVGIPAFSVGPGSEYIGKPKDWGDKKFQEYNTKHYHQPSDEFDPTWDFSEGVQMGQLGFWLGWEASNLTELPTWNKGDELLAAREKSLNEK